MSFGAFFSAILLLLVVFGLCYLSFRLGYYSADRKNIVQNYQYFQQPQTVPAESFPMDAPIPYLQSQPLERRNPIDQAFMQQLSSNGHAVVRLKGCKQNKNQYQ